MNSGFFIDPVQLLKIYLVEKTYLPCHQPSEQRDD